MTNSLPTSVSCESKMALCVLPMMSEETKGAVAYSRIFFNSLLEAALKVELTRSRDTGFELYKPAQ